MKDSSARLLRDAVGVFLLALAVNMVHIDHNGFYDEYYHLLAARSFLDDGTYQIGDGVYLRASLFTNLVAGALWLSGGSIVGARMVSAFFGALLVSVVFWWTARCTDRRAGYIAAFMLGVCPTIIFLSQLVRFYALHALVVWIGAISVFVLTDKQVPSGVRAISACAAISAFGIALHLQVTTIIALLVLAAWSLPQGVVRLISRGARVDRRTAGLAIAFALLAVIVALQPSSDWAGRMLERFRSAPLWAAESQNDVLFYHFWFLGNYPTFWALLPVLALVAVAKSPRFGSFLVAFLVGVIGLHSLAATKGERYIAYALPFFFSLCGVALSNAMVGLSTLVQRARNAISGSAVPDLDSRGYFAGVVVLVLAFLFASNPAFRMAYKMVRVDESEWPIGQPEYRGTPDWDAAAPILKAAAAEADVVMSSVGVKALYYLGRFDFELSASTTADSGGELVTDRRTGRRVVSTVGSVRSIYRCYRSGLVIVEDRHWWNSWAVSKSVSDFIELSTEPLELPSGSRLFAFTWRHADSGALDECADFLAQHAR